MRGQPLSNSAQPLEFINNLYPVDIPYGRKFWRGIYFGGLAVLRAIRQYFIRQKLHSVMSSLLRNHSLCTMLQLDAPVNSSACSLPLKAAHGNVASNCPKSLYTEGKRWLVCQPEEVDPNDVYTVTVKTDGTKTVQSKCYSDLLSFQLHLIIDFVLTQRKLVHGRLNSQRVRFCYEYHYG